MSTENQGVEENDLEKGNISNAFTSYGDKKFMLTKKGSEIKNALEVQIAHVRKCAVEHKAKAALYLEHIKEVPMGELKGHCIEPFTRQNIGEELPNIFDQGYIDVLVESSTDAKQEVEPTTEQKAIEQLKYKYNRCVRQACECIVEAKLAETMQNGIEDSKKYELTIRQAAALGL